MQDFQEVGTLYHKTIYSNGTDTEISRSIEVELGYKRSRSSDPSESMWLKVN